jgi:hypothetical protein
MIPRRAWAGYLILMLSLATVAEAGSSKIELRRDNAAGQEATNMKTSCWIDYSNTVGGVTEGVAMFQWPDGKEHRWLTREYGTFGPRRPDSQSGKPFTLKKGESIRQRVGILVYKGDLITGRGAQRSAVSRRRCSKETVAHRKRSCSCA